MKTRNRPRNTRQVKKAADLYPEPFDYPVPSEWQEGKQLTTISDHPQTMSYSAIENGLEHLALLADKDGWEGESSRMALHQILLLAVSRMNQLVCRHPDQWRRISGPRTDWPVLASLHPYYVNGMKRGAKLREFLERTLCLGRNSPVAHDPYAKSKLTSPITCVALSLLSHVEAARNTCEQVSGSPDDFLVRRMGMLERRRLTGWRRDAALLPPPAKRNAAKWADVAIAAYLESYPHPEQTFLKDEIGKHSKDEVPSHTGYPSQIKDRILFRLRKAICDLLVDRPENP